MQQSKPEMPHCTLKMSLEDCEEGVKETDQEPSLRQSYFAPPPSLVMWPKEMDRGDGLGDQPFPQGHVESQVSQVI